jgi:hypothetical protein
MEMEQYELGVAVALERIAALRHEADHVRSARPRRRAAALPDPPGWARQAHSYAIRVLWAFGIGLLPAAIALVTG